MESDLDALELNYLRQPTPVMESPTGERQEIINIPQTQEIIDALIANGWRIVPISEGK